MHTYHLKCDECGKEAKRFCSLCRKILCESCYSSHRNHDFRGILKIWSTPILIQYSYWRDFVG